MDSQKQEQKTTQVLPWHKKAAEGITDSNDFGIQSYAAETLAQTQYGLAAIIAQHDPHAETVRLLGELLAQMDACATFHQTFTPDVRESARAHLTKLKGTQ